VIVPSIVPDCGQACVPAGPLPRLVHRKTVIPPLTPFCPRWMCDWSVFPSIPLNDSRYRIVSECRSIAARKSPPPVLETAGTSS
jgi:hypothetical protein